MGISNNKIVKPEERKQLGSQYDHGLKDMWDEWNEYHNQVLEDGILSEEEIIEIVINNHQICDAKCKDCGSSNVLVNGRYDFIGRELYKAQMEKINKGR